MSETIKEFLVGLGFKIDESGYRKFATSINTSTSAVAKLGAAVVATAAIMEIGVRRMADRFEHLYYASEKTGAAVENIKALGYALSKIGGNADDAESALNSLASFMRGNPMASAFLAQFGVSTKTANGGLRDTFDILSDVVDSLTRMRNGGQFYLAKGYAGILGISEDQLLVLMRGTKEFSAEYHKMMQTAKIDAQDAAKTSMLFNNELRTTGAAFSILWDKIMVRIIKPRLEYSKSFREFILSHYDDISNAIDWVINKTEQFIEWIKAGFEAAKKGQFFGWIKGEFQKFVDWAAPYLKNAFDFAIREISLLWKKYSPPIIETMTVLSDWMQTEFIASIDVIGDYLGEKLAASIDKAKGRFWRWMNTPLWGDKRDAMDAEERRLEAEERQQRERELDLKRQMLRERLGGVFSAVGNAASSALSAVIPAASASEAAQSPMPLRDSIAAAYDFFTRHGLTSAQAAGVVGNLLHESRLNPAAVGDNGAAIGIAQWHGRRQRGAGDTLESQLQHVWDELNTTHRGALSSVLSSSTVADAARAFSDQFERPGIPLMESRIRQASAVLQQMEGANLGPRGRDFAQGRGRFDRDGNPVTLNQHTEIHVATTGNPADAAREVIAGQGRVNSRLARDMAGVVR